MAINNLNGTDNLKESVSKWNALVNKSNEYEGRISTVEQAQSAGVIGYETKGDLDADTSQSDQTLALVTNDSTAANNGWYRWDSGTSSWVARDEFYATSLDPTDESEAVTGKAVGDYVMPKNLSYTLLPYSGSDLGVEKLSENSIRFIGDEEIYIIGAKTIVLEANDGDYDFTFSTNGRTLCIDTNQPSSVNFNGYITYQAGGTDNALAEVSTSTLTDSNRYIPLVTYYNGEMFGFYVGQFLNKKETEKGVRDVKSLANMFFSPMSSGKNNITFPNQNNIKFTEHTYIHSSETGKLLELTADNFPVDFDLSDAGDGQTLVLDTSKDSDESGSFISYKLDGDDPAIYKVSHTSVDNKKHISLAYYYDGILEGAGLIGAYYTYENVNKQSIARNLEFSPMESGEDNIHYPSSRSVRFLDMVSLYNDLNGLLLLGDDQDSYPVDFQFDDSSSQILVFDFSKSQVDPSDTYSHYRLEGSNAAVYIVSHTDYDPKTQIPLLLSYRGKIVPSFGLMGLHYSNEKVGDSPFIRQKASVDRIALRYIKNMSDNENYIFAHIADIHHINGFDIESRLNNLDQSITYSNTTDLSDHLQCLVVNGDMAQGKQNNKADFQQDVDDIMQSYSLSAKSTFLTIGDHDDNSGEDDINEVYTKSDQRNNWIDPVLNNTNAEVGSDTDACYYYSDNNNHKIRKIFLDCIDMPYKDAGDGSTRTGAWQHLGLSNEQLNWLASIALDVPSTDWSVMIFIHHPPVLDDSKVPGSGWNNDISVVHEIINAFKNGISVDKSYTDDTFDGDLSYSVSEDYNTLNGGSCDFIGYFSGHKHADDIYESELYSDQKIFITNCALTQRSPNHGDRVNRTVGTETQNCFDIVVVDQDEKKVRALRFGAGITPDAMSPDLILIRTFDY